MTTRSPSRFPAGLRLASHKSAASARPLRLALPPVQAVLSLDQGSGRAATACIEPGARVRVGTVVAVDGESRHPMLHAPVSGTVRGIEMRADASGSGEGLAILIDNDGADEREPSLAPLDDALELDPDALIEHLSRSGIVGLGGAAFPTAVKLATALASEATHLVLNGAECEPWICCDDALMRERAPRIVLGARLLMQASGAARGTIAVEDDKPRAIAALRAALDTEADERLALQVIPAVYPAGAERQLLSSVTGIEVPTGRVPADVGLLCQNVGTAAAVADFVLTGVPCLRRIVTVTGSGVAQPVNVDARIGTAIANLVELAGGYAGQPERLIVGGTLTGRAVPSDAIGLTKAMNCLVVATRDDLAPRGTEMPCIRCGDCATVCPPGLLPQQLLRALQAADRAALERHGLADCIECGCCDHVCPSQIPLTQRFRVARREASERFDLLERAAQARQRYERHQARLEAEAEAERRTFDEARRRARGEESP